MGLPFVLLELTWWLLFVRSLFLLYWSFSAIVSGSNQDASHNMDLSAHLEEVLSLQGGSFVDIEASITSPLPVLSSGSRSGVYRGLGVACMRSGGTLASTCCHASTAPCSSGFRSAGVRLGWSLCLITPSLMLAAG